MTSTAKRRPASGAAGTLEHGEGRRLAPLIPRTLPEQVADRIVNAIGRGVLRPDERLIETELATELAVSRVPVRDALRTLVTQGVVRAEPNRGVRVVRFDQAKIDEVRSARIALERLAARLVAERRRHDPGIMDAMADTIATMRNCAEARDIPGLNRADIMFHDALYAASGNRTLAALWRSIARQVEIIFASEMARVPDPELLATEHVRLCDAIRTADPDALDREVAAHIAESRALAPAGAKRSQTSRSEGEGL